MDTFWTGVNRKNLIGVWVYGIDTKGVAGDVARIDLMFLKN